jgi:hypothetical protein
VPRSWEREFSGEIQHVRPALPQPMPQRSRGPSPVPEGEFAAVRLNVVFAPEKGTRDPLVSVGDVGRADFVFVEYLEAGQLRFGFDHWGKPTRYSEPRTIRSGEPCMLEIALGSFGRESGIRREAIAPVRITVDGRVAWEFATKLYPVEPEDVFVGHNPIGGTSTAASFSGVISSIEWVRDESVTRK